MISVSSRTILFSTFRLFFIRSAPHHLNPDSVLRDYRRNADVVEAISAGSDMALNPSPAELKQITILRHNALNQLVQHLLVPEFRPLRTSAATVPSHPKLSRDELRIIRHRKARLRAEEILTSQNKPVGCSL